jgi:hypothetical protein
MKYASDVSCREHQNTCFTFNVYIFFRNRAFMRQCRKKDAQHGLLQMTIWRMRIARWYVRVQTHTLGIRNTYCFFAATMVKTKAHQYSFTRTLSFFVKTSSFLVISVFINVWSLQICVCVIVWYFLFHRRYIAGKYYVAPIFRILLKCKRDIQCTCTAVRHKSEPL